MRYTLLKKIILISVPLIFISSITFASDLTGTWEGSVVCSGVEYKLQIGMQGNQGEVHYTRGRDSASYNVSANFNSSKNRWNIIRGKWINKLQGGPRFTFKSEAEFGDSLKLKVTNLSCKEFSVKRTSDEVTFSEPQVASGPRSAPAQRDAQARTRQSQGAQTQNRRGRFEPQQQQQTQTRNRQQTRQQPTTDGRRRSQATTQSTAEYDANCNKIIAWSEQVEKDNPHVDFQSRPYEVMADLFIDKHFVPVFGKSFSKMNEPERLGLWNRTIKPCFKPTGDKKFYWQRQELIRAFRENDVQFSYKDVMRYVSMKSDKGDWIEEAIKKLNGLSAKNDADEIKTIAEEGRIRYIGLPSSKKDSFNTAVQKTGAGFKKHKVDPKATHVSFPGKEFPMQVREMVISNATPLGRNAGEMYLCDKERAAEVKTEYLTEVNRIYPEKMIEAEISFDNVFADYLLKDPLPQKAPERSSYTPYNPREERRVRGNCEDLVDQYEERLIKTLDMLNLAVASDAGGRLLGPKGDEKGRPYGFTAGRLREDYSSGQLAIAANVNISNDPGAFDPKLYEKIKGDLDELNHLGRRLEALQAGVIWYNKYTARFGQLQEPAYRHNIEIFWKRRRLDGEEAKQQIGSFLQDYKITFEQYNTFMERNLSLKMDKNLISHLGFTGMVALRKLKFVKLAEFEKIKERNKGKRKAAGAVGEIEIMKAYVNSRNQVLNLQAVLSPHSISYQFILDPIIPVMVSTVESAEAHSCEKIGKDTYDCVISMTISSLYSELFEGLKKRTNDASLKIMGELVKEQSIRKDRGVFTKKNGRWTSPTLIKGFQQTLNEMGESGQEYQEMQDALETDWPE